MSSSTDEYLQAQLAQIERSGLRRERRQTQPLAGGRVRLDGRDLLDFTSNDYLGLRTHPALIEAACQAAAKAGVGAGSSPVVTGRTDYHVQLEQSLAELEQTEAALLFPTGYAANLGVLAALAGPADRVYCDRANHASLIDGSRLSNAAFRVYRRTRLDRLERALSRTESGRTLLVTDTVFSMDGELAPLAELAELATAHDAQLILDEAHATGLYGQTGSGLTSELGLPTEAAIRIGTLSKALGAMGGFVCGSSALIDLLSNTARTQFFSTALPPPVCAAASAAVQLVHSEPERRRRVRAKAREIRHGLRSLGWHVFGEPDCPIIPVLCGTPALAMRIAADLQERGILAAAVRPPTVPRGTSRLRLSLSAAHSDEDLQQLLEAFDQLDAPDIDLSSLPPTGLIPTLSPVTDRSPH